MMCLSFCKRRQQVDFYLRYKHQLSQQFEAMQKLKTKGCEGENYLMSPAAFILDLEPQEMPYLDLAQASAPIDFPSDPNFKHSVEQGAKTSSREEKKRLAGLRSRQKKKKYVQSLEQNVKLMGAELERCELQISQCKDQIVQAIRSANNPANEHAFTYSELERQALSEDPDIDRINLLLDVIQNRIGANAQERQANLDYNFKQIINSMFPAMHRYLMHAASYQLDIFNPTLSLQQLTNNSRWTQELYQRLNLDQPQLQYYRQSSDQFRQKRTEAIEYIGRLRDIKNKLKQQEEILERGILDIRQEVTPVQSAHLTVFGEKNKLRKEFIIANELEIYIGGNTEAAGGGTEGGPRKRIKTERL